MKNVLAVIGGLVAFTLVAGVSCVGGIAIGRFAGGDGLASVKDSVAVIDVTGQISGGDGSGLNADGAHSDAIVRLLRRAENDAHVKAVLLRVDSPGGGVTASDEIRNQVLKTKAKKPVVVSMGSLAASGGYYISAPANRIVANETSLVGSIGVIVTVPNVQGLMEKLGVNVEVLKSGAAKDATSGLRPLTDADRAILQDVVEETFGRFVDIVADGRSLTRDQVRALADGRIYTARQAKALGLVDEFGDMPEAVKVAGDLGAIIGEPPIIRYRTGGLLRSLTGAAAGVLGLPALPALPAVPGVSGGQSGFSVQYLYVP